MLYLKVGYSVILLWPTFMFCFFSSFNGTIAVPQLTTKYILDISYNRLRTPICIYSFNIKS